MNEQKNDQTTWKLIRDVQRSRLDQKSPLLSVLPHVSAPSMEAPEALSNTEVGQLTKIHKTSHWLVWPAVSLTFSAIALILFFLYDVQAILVLFAFVGLILVSSVFQVFQTRAFLNALVTANLKLNTSGRAASNWPGR